MNRNEIWKKQGSYKTLEGVKMVLEMDKETGATVLAPVQSKSKRKCLRCGDILSFNDDLICGYHQLQDN